MNNKKSVVTPERFTKGLTYAEYVSRIKSRPEQYQLNYDSFQLSEDNKKFFRRAAQVPDGIAKMLVIGADACPDAFGGIPVMVRIAEAAGIEMRLFFRDENQDIINEFLKEGQFQAVPVAVFYTKDMRYICHWIERPALANKERDQFVAEAKAIKPDATREDIIKLVGKKFVDRTSVWQQATAQELRDLITKKLGL